MNKTLDLTNRSDAERFRHHWRVYLGDMAAPSSFDMREAMMAGDINAIAGPRISDETIYYSVNMETAQHAQGQYARAVEIIRDEARDAVHTWYDYVASGDGSLGTLWIVLADGLAHQSRYPRLYDDRINFDASQEEEALEYLHLVSNDDQKHTLAKLTSDGYVDFFYEDVQYDLT